MTQQSPFDKMHVEDVTPSQRTLLDELQLPPKLAAFLREQADTLKKIAISFVVIISLWSFWGWYSEKQQNDSTALLAEAMSQGDATARQQMLARVVDEYSSSDAAMWSRITLAQEQQQEGEFGAAIAVYKDVADDIARDNPLYPLVIQAMAVSHEMQGSHQEALVNFAALRDMPGFAATGYLGEARIHEKMGQIAEARDAYEKANTQVDLSPTLKEWLAGKLARR